MEVPPDSAGINGTPMPESGDALTPGQVWQIVHYVQALGACARECTTGCPHQGADRDADQSPQVVARSE